MGVVIVVPAVVHDLCLNCRIVALPIAESRPMAIPDVRALVVGVAIRKASDQKWHRLLSEKFYPRGRQEAAHKNGHGLIGEYRHVLWAGKRSETIGANVRCLPIQIFSITSKIPTESYIRSQGTAEVFQHEGYFKLHITRIELSNMGALDLYRINSYPNTLSGDELISRDSRLGGRSHSLFIGSVNAVTHGDGLNLRPIGVIPETEQADDRDQQRRVIIAIALFALCAAVTSFGCLLIWNAPTSRSAGWLAGLALTLCGWWIFNHAMDLSYADARLRLALGCRDKRDGQRQFLGYRRGILVAIEINHKALERNWLAVDQFRASREYLFDYVSGTFSGSRNTTPINLSAPAITERQIRGKNLEVVDRCAVVERGKCLAMASIKSVRIRESPPNHRGLLLRLNQFDVGTSQPIPDKNVGESGWNTRLRPADALIRRHVNRTSIIMERPDFDLDIGGRGFAGSLKICEEAPTLSMTYEFPQSSIGNAESNNGPFGEIHCQRQYADGQQGQRWAS